MKKILSIIVLGLLLGGNVYADPKNPSNLWLKTQNVNSLTQEHGYQLVHTVALTSQIAWTLTKPKSSKRDGKFIVVTCYSGGEDEKVTCWLP